MKYLLSLILILSVNSYAVERVDLVTHVNRILKLPRQGKAVPNVGDYEVKMYAYKLIMQNNNDYAYFTDYTNEEGVNLMVILEKNPELVQEINNYFEDNHLQSFNKPHVPFLRYAAPETYTAPLYLIVRPDGLSRATENGKDPNFPKFKVTEICEDFHWRKCTKTSAAVSPAQAAAQGVMSKITSFFGK